MQIKHLYMALCLLVSACSSEVNTQSLAPEGTQSERIAHIQTLLSITPTVILDAHMLEQPMGDNRLGPADYLGFYYLQVPPQQLLEWSSSLTPMPSAPQFSTPDKPVPWWVTKQAFNALAFYEVVGLSKYRTNGWVGINANTGQIYWHDYTT